MFIVKYRNIFFGLTAIVVLVSLASVAVYGIRPGIEFTGGALVQVTYPDGRPTAGAMESSLEGAGFSGFTIREAGADDYIVRTPILSAAERAALPEALSNAGPGATIGQLNEIGPTIGKELRNKAFLAIALVLIAILLFIAFAFRKVSKPVSSWVYGLIALATLVHDVIVPTGFAAALGHFAGMQIDTLFVTAILTILGFSIHDTIVVFDRTRENLRINEERNRKEDFAETAGRALKQTIVRSINTSLTVVLTLSVLFFIGPASTKDFSLVLLVGIIAGTYSSIFFATPLLVTVERWRRS